MRLALTVLLLFTPTLVAAEPPLVIRNATVETLAAGGSMEGATVVVRDGKIAAVGKNLAFPTSATVIDAAGGTLMPGIIDPYFEVAITGGAADAAPRTVVIGGRTITIPGGGSRGSSSFTRVADNFYPHDSGFKPLPRLGLTRLNLLTSGTGQSAIIRVTPKQPNQMLAIPDGLAFAAATNSSESLDQIRSRLSPRGGGRPGFGGPMAGTQLWSDVAAGKAALVVECSNSAAVLHLLKATASNKNINLVLYLGGEAIAETIDALKNRKLTVILRPALELLPNTRDRFNPARMLHEAGVDFAFSLTARAAQTGGGGFGGAAPTAPAARGPAIDADFPLFAIALLVKTGLPRAAALEAIAKKPATILGLDKTHGTIEPGKSADLLLFTGDPLDAASRLTRTIIDGRIVYAP